MSLRIANGSRNFSAFRQSNVDCGIGRMSAYAGEIAAARLKLLPVARRMRDCECAVIRRNGNGKIVDHDRRLRHRGLAIFGNDAALDCHAGVERAIELRRRAKRRRFIDDRVIGMDDDDPVRPFRRIGNAVVAVRISLCEEVARVPQPDDRRPSDRLTVRDDRAALHRCSD